MLWGTQSVSAGIIVITNDAGKTASTSSGTSASAVAALDGKQTSVVFVDRIIGYKDPTTGGTDPGDAGYSTSSAGTSQNTKVWLANTCRQPSGTSGSAGASFGIVNGSATLPGTVSPINKGTGQYLSATLHANTVGNNVATIEVHRGTPYGSGNVTVGTWQDKNDTIRLQAAVYDHSHASFDYGTQTTSLLIDFGKVTVNDTASQSFSIYNNDPLGAYTSHLDLVSIVPVLGPVQSGANVTIQPPFDSDLTVFSGLAEGTGNFCNVSFTPTTTGTFDQIYTLNFSDDQTMLGHTTSKMTLEFRGVGHVPEPSSIVGFGLIASVFGLTWFVRRGKVTA